MKVNIGNINTITNHTNNTNNNNCHLRAAIDQQSSFHHSQLYPSVNNENVNPNHNQSATHRDRS